MVRRRDSKGNIRFMTSLLLSRRDLDFLLYEWLDVPSLTARPRYADHSRETFDAALDLSEQVATRHFAPHNKRNDAEEPRFDGERVHLIPEVGEALAVFAGTGLLGSAMDYEVGGAQLPSVVASACFAWSICPMDRFAKALIRQAERRSSGFLQIRYSSAFCFAISGRPLK